MSRMKNFESALKFASRLHAKQARKGSNAPYISHLLAVAAIALEHGATEKEAIAALLHDAVEDQGGQATLDEIRRRYGKRVARIVDAVSDTDQSPKPPWRERKEAYVERIRSEPYSVRLVVAADKLHNLRDLLSSYRVQGDDLWTHFKGGRCGPSLKRSIARSPPCGRKSPNGTWRQPRGTSPDFTGTRKTRAASPTHAAANVGWPERREPCVGSRSCPSSCSPS
jgi:5'-deoxynucleotidase YfbR-like HD superfamily hydrolase